MSLPPSDNDLCASRTPTFGRMRKNCQATDRNELSLQRRVNCIRPRVFQANGLTHAHRKFTEAFAQNRDMALRADANTQKIFASATSHLVGGYEREEILLSLAWPGMRDRSLDDSKQRSAFVIAFKTEPIERLLGTVIPEYSLVGETICAYLSVLFGKRFDNHGGFEIHGSFYVPDLRSFTTIYLRELPQNSPRPRVDLPVSPNLAEFSRIRRLIVGPLSRLCARVFKDLTDDGRPCRAAPGTVSQGDSRRPSRSAKRSNPWCRRSWS
jgi:hypothetical protein